ncbi:hypothetical protein ACDT12_13605 [Staphylococcus aureus]
MTMIMMMMMTMEMMMMMTMTTTTMMMMILINVIISLRHDRSCYMSLIMDNQMLQLCQTLYMSPA